MSLALSPASRPRRLRAALNGCGAASSLLRLSRAASALPSGAALTDWMTRAGSMLEGDGDASLLARLAAPAPR